MPRPSNLPPVNQNKLTQLVGGTYTNALRLATSAGKYLGYTSFQATDIPVNAIWVLRQGSFRQSRGYWIFRPGMDRCWQAVNSNGPLTYWNADGTAKRVPQAWELFLFEIVDASAGGIRIRNVHDWPLGGSVVLGSDGFRCDASPQNATTLYVEFL
jgi:hypothetical protein